MYLNEIGFIQIPVEKDDVMKEKTKELKIKDIW